MGQVGKVGKLLGPKGLMPNPKLGTVTFEVGKAIADQKKGSIEYRTEKAGVVHCSFGRKSMGAEKLKDNFMALYFAILKAKPATSKGNYLKKISLTTTMGPSLVLDASKIKVEG
jgi:large subunit ribosomal protein L1